MNFSPLIEEIAHAESDFYRSRWAAERDFAKLPAVSREDFIRTPLSKRRYKEESSLVKIVHAEQPFLSEWSFADIGTEGFGLPSTRPLVYMTDSYEAIEKSMWCYERGMVPLIGEKDPDIAMFAAGKYEVDSLITDPEALPKLRPYLEAHRLQSISVISDSFDTNALAPFASLTDDMRLVLAIPEVGSFAIAPFAVRPRFEALENCAVEKGETLIVSKLRFLITPIIRYRTDIPASLYDGS